MAIKNFFYPESIAVIGASDHFEKIGGILMQKLFNFKGKIIPVNPRHDFLFDFKCYKTVNDYPEKIDLAVIAIPHDFVFQAIEDCGKKKIKNVIIISAGFSEIGDIIGEQKITALAKKYGISFLGPNCFGVFNSNNSLDLTFSATTPNKGGIAFVSQSGALWSYISDYDNIGFSKFASLGNMADLEFSDFIECLSRDNKTKSIVLYVEKLKDGKRFIKTCQKCKKKVYVVKAGISAEGSKAAFSHTGSLATDYEVYKGAFKQAGIILCSSLLEAFERAGRKKLIPIVRKKIKIGKRIFIVTNAGGAGALAADYLSEKGFEVAAPMDILGTANGSSYLNAFDKLKFNSDIDSILVILTPQSMSEIKKTAQVIALMKTQINKKIIALFLGKKSMKEANKIFKENQIDFFNTLEEARAALVF